MLPDEIEYQHFEIMEKIFPLFESGTHTWTAASYFRNHFDVYTIRVTIISIVVVIILVIILLLYKRREWSLRLEIVIWLTNRSF